MRLSARATTIGTMCIEWIVTIQQVSQSHDHALRGTSYESVFSFRN
jgi:hypothetical protein